ncbi:anthrone oxygenase tpcL [Aspergillus stella-maris]|uniref:anthrone oxygenase tpcL n=1 Tax=Aspergillus stella-maris TaxID=1810926 RepID=UPI003CCDCD09
MATGTLSASPSLSTLKSTAVVSGSFLSGAMMTLSTITVPVLLDTTTHPPQLLHQWVRTYHYGHISLPTISAATAVLYFYIAVVQSSKSRPWRKAALVGVLTLVMVPFTWVIMNGTNEVLFGLQRGTEGFLVGGSNGNGTGMADAEAGAGATIEGVRGLVVKWGWMHLVRSLFPLLAAVLGLGICV